MYHHSNRKEPLQPPVREKLWRISTRKGTLMTTITLVLGQDVQLHGNNSYNLEGLISSYGVNRDSLQF